MERYCSTGQSPQRAVAPTEEEEEKEEEEENAALRVNKMCRIKQVKQNYMHIKINGNKSQVRKTTYNAIKYRINEKTEPKPAHVSYTFIYEHLLYILM
jgi:hypothetical protein